MMIVHLADSSEPLTLTGGDQRVLCGEIVSHAMPVMLLDDLVVDADGIVGSNLGAFCRHCLQIEIEKRYIYGLVAGEELKHLEEEEGECRKTAPNI